MLSALSLGIPVCLSDRFQKTWHNIFKAYQMVW